MVVLVNNSFALSLGDRNSSSISDLNFAINDDKNNDTDYNENPEQSMCKAGYNATVTQNFNLLLLPGTSFAFLSILLNIAVFLTFKRIRASSSSQASSRSVIHFSFLAILNIFVGVSFVISQFHAMGYDSYDDLYLAYAKEPICEDNQTHAVSALFTVFETSYNSGRVVKGYSIFRYFFELMDRFANAYIAVDRTLIVCLPMTYGLRKQRASDVSVSREFSGWVILPPALFTFTVVLVLAVKDKLEHIYEVYFLLVLVLELPILPMIVSGFVLFVKSVAGRGRDPPQIREGISNIKHVTLALVLIFLVCDVPNLAFQVGLWAGYKRISDSANPSYFFFNHLQHVARMISCFFHFFVYFAMSERFRVNLVAVLKRCFCCDDGNSVVNDKARLTDASVADQVVQQIGKSYQIDGLPDDGLRC